MKIALIGYGKMGQAIEKIAIERGHTIAARITSANAAEIDTAHFAGVDVAIEFTAPSVARENVMKCLAAGVNVVSGTTGWGEDVPEAEQYATANGRALLHASNFSVGVNIFFEVNKLLARLMNGREDYTVSIEETHHTQKKDAPSGTAISLARQIVGQISDKKKWVLNDFNDKSAVPIIAHRIENVPGTHKVSYESAIDTIDIVHTAHNRDGFATGAVLAAEYIADKQGVFTMKDVLGIN